MHENQQMRISIAAARSPEDILAVRGLFLEYIAWLGLDLSFQGVDREFAEFPGGYAPPQGDLFLAKREDGVPVGCIGVRPMSTPGACEMKRAYVVEAARGTGTGRALVGAVIRFAETTGYREMFLDSLPRFSAAHAIFRRVGFEAVAPYYYNPVPGALFFRKTLNAGERSEMVQPKGFTGN